MLFVGTCLQRTQGMPSCLILSPQSCFRNSVKRLNTRKHRLEESGPSMYAAHWGNSPSAPPRAPGAPTAAQHHRGSSFQENEKLSHLVPRGGHLPHTLLTDRRWRPSTRDGPPSIGSVLQKTQRSRRKSWHVFALDQCRWSLTNYGN